MMTRVMAGLLNPHHRSSMANLKASINFGLVHIPVELATAEDRQEGISFNMLDSKDMSRIRYKRVNENTGKEVDWEDIIKGYEVSKDEYVTFTEQELKELAAEANRSIEIEAFIDKDEVSPVLFETPYFMLPGKGGEKGYAVLQRVLAKAEKYAVVQAVLRNREHLGVIFPDNGALMLGLLRYASELKKPEDVIPSTLEKVKVTDKELSMAERLLKEMSARFKPNQYKDHYAEKLQQAVQDKRKGKKPRKVKSEEKQTKGLVDIQELLERSLKEKAQKPRSKKRA